MPYLEWSDDLSCGFGEFDDDHKRLIDIFNQLHEAVETKQGADAIGDVFEELISYTAWHFRHEERVMQQYEYPEYMEHKQIHDDLTGQAKSLYEQFAAGDIDVPGKLIPFLKDWLTEHILGMDKQTGTYLAAQAG